MKEESLKCYQNKKTKPEGTHIRAFAKSFVAGLSQWSDLWLMDLFLTLAAITHKATDASKCL